MSEETLKRLIHAFNRKKLPKWSTIRVLDATVELAYVWRAARMGLDSPSRPDTVYFVLSEGRAVGAVYEMGDTDLHWYMLKSHRGKGHLARALAEIILPHVFADGRESQRVTVETTENAGYVQKRGFKKVDEGVFEMQKSAVASARVPLGKNVPLTPKEVEEMKSRLHEARRLIMSVHSALLSRYGKDPLSLKKYACGVGSMIPDLRFINDDGEFR